MVILGGWVFLMSEVPLYLGDVDWLEKLEVVRVGVRASLEQRPHRRLTPCTREKRVFSSYTRILGDI